MIDYKEPEKYVPASLVQEAAKNSFNLGFIYGAGAIVAIFTMAQIIGYLL